MLIEWLRRKEGSISRPCEHVAARPLISFITASYNSASSIEETIESVSSCKAHISCEYIIIDGNSNDGTKQILSRHSESIDVLITEPDSGIYDAMNKGLLVASGEYICFVNADDRIILDGAMKIAWKLNRSGCTIDILASAAVAVDGMMKSLWLPTDLDRFLVFRCPNLCHNAVYAHRSVFTRIGTFDSSLQIAADSEWIIRAVRAGAKVRVVNTPAVHYTLGGMSSDTVRHAKEMQLVAKKTYPLLRSEIIQSLFYHLFAWQDRRSLFAEKPPMDLADSLREASAFYPELSLSNYVLGGLHRRLAGKALSQLKHTIRRRFVR